jgi:hypothetical protein
MGRRRRSTRTQDSGLDDLGDRPPYRARPQDHPGLPERRPRSRRAQRAVDPFAPFLDFVTARLLGFGEHGEHGEQGGWGGYWGKEGPEFLERRLALYSEPKLMVLGAITFAMFVSMIGPRSGATQDLDPVKERMRSLPTTVFQTRSTGRRTGRT